MRVEFNPQTAKFWEQHFISGQGRVFVGQRNQRGGSLGSFLKGILRFIIPVAKSAGKAIGKQALKTGAAIASDVAEGRDIREAAEEHGQVAMKRLARQVTGAKRRRRRGKKGKGLGKRPAQKTIKAVKKGKKGRRKKKSDTLGYYY